MGIALSSKDNQASQNNSSPAQYAYAQNKVRVAQLELQGAGLQLLQSTFAQKTAANAPVLAKCDRGSAVPPTNHQALVTHFISCSAVLPKSQNRAVDRLGAPKEDGAPSLGRQQLATAARCPPWGLASCFVKPSEIICKVGQVNNCYQLFWPFCWLSVLLAAKLILEFISPFWRNTSTGGNQLMGDACLGSRRTRQSCWHFRMEVLKSSNLTLMRETFHPTTHTNYT